MTESSPYFACDLGAADLDFRPAITTGIRMTGNFFSAPDRAVPNRGHPRGVARKNWHGHLDPGRTADGNAVCWEDLRFKRRKAMIRTYPWSEASIERIIFKDCSLYREESFHDFPG